MKKLVYSARRPEQISPTTQRNSRKNVDTVCTVLGLGTPNVSRTDIGHKLVWDGVPFLYSYRVDETCKELCDHYGINYNEISRITSPYKKIGEIGNLLGIRFYGDPGFDEFDELWKRLLRKDPKVKERAKSIAEEDLDEVYELTGINCLIDNRGYLIVPYAEG